MRVFPAGILQIPKEILTKTLIIEQILGFLLNFNKIFTQNRYKINMEYVLTQLIVCGVIKTSIFSHEILDKKRIPAGSRQEKNALPIP